MSVCPCVGEGRGAVVSGRRGIRCYMTLHTEEELLEDAAGTFGSVASWNVTISAVTTGCCCSCSAFVSRTPRSSAASCREWRDEGYVKRRGMRYG